MPITRYFVVRTDGGTVEVRYTLRILDMAYAEDIWEAVERSVVPEYLCTKRTSCL